MVSQATSFGFSTCFKTSLCRTGSILARKTTSRPRQPAGSFGRKAWKTLSWVSRVFASFSWNPYSPFQRKVFPGTRSRPERSIFLLSRNRRCSWGKSSPTTATRDTSVKKPAATEKYVAEPPRTSWAWPKGVLTESNATEPTTSSPTWTSGLFLYFFQGFDGFPGGFTHFCIGIRGGALEPGKGAQVPQGLEALDRPQPHRRIGIPQRVQKYAQPDRTGGVPRQGKESGPAHVGFGVPE